MTQKAIGPSFYDELAAYGIANNIVIIGTHFSWDSLGDLFFCSDTPAAVVTAVEAVYAAHNPSVIPPQMQAATAFAAGLTVSSTGTPAINGTYALDAATQFEINSVQLFVQVNGDFPGGTGTYPWFDTSGAAHIFPGIAVFKDWATAIANYVAALKLYAAGAPGASFPAAAATIA